MRFRQALEQKAEKEGRADADLFNLSGGISGGIGGLGVVLLALKLGSSLGAGAAPDAAAPMTVESAATAANRPAPTETEAEPPPTPVADPGALLMCAARRGQALARGRASSAPPARRSGAEGSGRPLS